MVSLFLFLSLSLADLLDREYRVATEGPSWGHSKVVLGAISSFLEPFCRHLSPKIDKVSEELTLRYPHEEPCVVPGPGRAFGNDRIEGSHLRPIYCCNTQLLARELLRRRRRSNRGGWARFCHIYQRAATQRYTRPLTPRTRAWRRAVPGPVRGSWTRSSRVDQAGNFQHLLTTFLLIHSPNASVASSCPWAWSEVLDRIQSRRPGRHYPHIYYRL